MKGFETPELFRVPTGFEELDTLIKKKAWRCMQINKKLPARAVLNRAQAESFDMERIDTDLPFPILEINGHPSLPRSGYPSYRGNLCHPEGVQCTQLHSRYP